MAAAAAKVLLPIADTACKTPGARLTLAMIMPLNPINPFNWFVLIAIVLTCYFQTSISFLNTAKNAETGKYESSFGRSVILGFFIYYIIMFLISNMMLKGACKGVGVASQVTSIQ